MMSEITGIVQGLMLPIIVIGLAVAALSAFVVLARNYRKCPPNKVLVVYGRTGADGKGFRLITGGATFVYPLLEDFTEIGLENFSVEAQVLKSPNSDGVPVSVDAIANIKVSSNPQLLSAAVERMLGKPTLEVRAMLKQTLDGLLRQIIGTLTIEEMVKDREKLAQGVLTNASAELNKLGFEIDNFVINKLWDDEGYIDALGAKRTAEVQRDANVAKAEADREALVKSSEARQLGETAKLAADQQIAEANRDLAMKQATFKTETETAQAEADMAGELKRAEIDKTLRQRKVLAESAETTAKIELADQEAIRMEKELVYTTIKPAEAKAKAATITAEGNAQAAAKQADATRSTAEADKVKLTLEGEGRAAADAAQKRIVGLAEAESTEAKGKAEASATLARLLADAEGLLKKNEALEKMSDAARLILFLDHLPEIIDKTGDAGQKMISAAFEHIGTGISRIDSINLVDLGGGGNGNGSDPLSKFIMSMPKTVFNTLAQAKAMGMDFEGILENLGVPKGSLDGLLASLKHVGTGTTDEAGDHATS